MRTSAGIAVLALLLAACAPLEGRSRVSARLDPEKKHRLAPGASVAVLVDPELPDAGFKWDFANQIGTAMKARGFAVAPVEEADLLVFFGFGTRTEVRLTNPKTKWRSSNRRVYDHWFRIVVSDAEAFRQDGTASVLWAGEAVLAEQLTEAPSDDVEHLQRILERMCRKTVAALGKEIRPRRIVFERE